jgi:hypothetical protein
MPHVTDDFRTSLFEGEDGEPPAPPEEDEDEEVEEEEVRALGRQNEWAPLDELDQMAFYSGETLSRIGL